MAKIEFFLEESEDFPASSESVEVRVWSLGGTEDQVFYIGSGVNFQASANTLVEIIYSVQSAPIFYTRNFFHHYSYHGDKDLVAPMNARLDEIVEAGEGKIAFGDILPETTIAMNFKKSTYTDLDGAEKEHQSVELMISADIGAVFGRSSPGTRSIDLKLTCLDLEEGVRFMRELIEELGAVQRGKHPDPAQFPAGSSYWPFTWQLNRLAYNRISETYQEDYFELPLLVEGFDDWLAQLPPGGRVLDAGCGHGQPVMARLLEKGFQVTGSDFSPEMLERAARQFPQAAFVRQATYALEMQDAFDGACSFSSMHYMDPIDLLNSIYRLHQALKPGGLLFLYGSDIGPSWRGDPFYPVIGQWMWSWHYGMEELAGLLEEHGYFEVLRMEKVQVDEQEAERIAQELEEDKKEEAAYYERQANDPEAFAMPYFKKRVKYSLYSYLVVARRCER